MRHLCPLSWEILKRFLGKISTNSLSWDVSNCLCMVILELHQWINGRKQQYSQPLTKHWLKGWCMYVPVLGYFCPETNAVLVPSMRYPHLITVLGVENWLAHSWIHCTITVTFSHFRLKVFLYITFQNLRMIGLTSSGSPLGWYGQHSQVEVPTTRFAEPD